ncbi:MAG: PKD domain-containing protein [Bacteroidales bacterium]|nr:PKD domain-containing protein [Bacteroidales bacterium]
MNIGLIVFLSAYITRAQDIPQVNYNYSITDNVQTPLRLAINKQDIIYVVDAKEKCVLSFDTTGRLLNRIESVFAPVSIAVDNENNIYVGDAETGAIYKIDNDGFSTLFYNGTIFPSSMTFDSENLLYIVDSELKHVVVLNRSGQLIRIIGAGTFLYPTGIAYNPLNNRIYIAEHGGIGTGFKPLVKIWVFDLQGNLINSFASHGNKEGQFYRIQGMAIDRCGKLYAVDPFQASISVFENEQFLTKFGEYGKNSSQLNVPIDIAFDSQGRAWISSMNNGALEIYNITETAPSSRISCNKTNICSGDTAYIKVYFTGTAPWSFTYTVDDLNPEEITTSNNPYILPAYKEGTYKITALSDAGSTASCLSGSVKIVINPLPLIDLGSDIELCSGESYTLDAGAEFKNYLWTGGSTQQRLIVDSTGHYKVIVTDSLDCENSDEVFVLVNPLPSADFSYSGEGLEISFFNNSKNADSYFWDFGDEQTAYENNPIHTYQTPGEYEVVLIASNTKCGNSQFKQTINIIGTFVELFNATDLALIYPNPSNGIFTIEIKKHTVSNVKVEIMDIAGQILYKKYYKSANIIDKINMSSYPKGVYTIKFSADNVVKTGKIIIQ